jgi:hypothetical protein
MNQIKYENIIDDLINEKLVLQTEIESLKSLLQYWDLRKEEIIGKQIRLVSTTDAHTIVKPNDYGVVSHVDDAGTIFINWDNGSMLGLIPGIDFFEVL